MASPKNGNGNGPVLLPFPFPFPFLAVPEPVLFPFLYPFLAVPVPVLGRFFSVPSVFFSVFVPVPVRSCAMASKNGNGFLAVPVPVLNPFQIRSRSRWAHLCLCAALQSATSPPGLEHAPAAPLPPAPPRARSGSDATATPSGVLPLGLPCALAPRQLACFLPFSRLAHAP